MQSLTYSTHKISTPTPSLPAYNEIMKYDGNAHGHTAYRHRVQADNVQSYKVIKMKPHTHMPTSS